MTMPYVPELSEKAGRFAKKYKICIFNHQNTIRKHIVELIQKWHSGN